MKFSEVFKNQFYNKMLQPNGDNPIRNRADSLLTVFQTLEQKSNKSFTVVETGCMRSDHGDMCFGDDGCSTYIFDTFINFYDGELYSVDISEKNCNYAKSKTGNKATVICKDSVKFLWEFNKHIDFLYLDSYDLELKNPHPSQLHHLKELCASIKNLKKNSIIVVDDHLISMNIGKGFYIKSFMKDIGAQLLFEDYQIGWVL